MFRLSISNLKRYALVFALLVSTSCVIILFLDDLQLLSIPVTTWESRGVEFTCNCEVKCSGNTSSGIDLSNTSITNRKLYTFGKVNPPAVLLQLRGGMGNQLFEYACHYAIARKNNWPLYTFISSKISNSVRNFRPEAREFALDQFNIPLFEWNTVDETWVISDQREEVGDSKMLSGLYASDQVIQQFQHSNTDYCQSEAFFAPYKDEILHLFTQKVLMDSTVLLNWIEIIDSKPESVAVHIRRGDFISRNIVVPISFHKDAMKRIASMLDKEPTFFVFTDDVDFAEAELMSRGDEHEFIKKSQIYIVSSGHSSLLSRVVSLEMLSTGKLTSLQEFHLMTRCKHNIIPNSSFGWWAAYLNRNPKKIVIAAHQNLDLFDNEDFTNRWLYRHIYYPYGWITVNPF